MVAAALTAVGVRLAVGRGVGDGGGVGGTQAALIARIKIIAA
jgi:hypothetical protein